MFWTLLESSRNFQEHSRTFLKRESFRRFCKLPEHSGSCQISTAHNSVGMTATRVVQTSKWLWKSRLSLVWLQFFCKIDKQTGITTQSVEVWKRRCQIVSSECWVYARLPNRHRNGSYPSIFFRVTSPWGAMRDGMFQLERDHRAGRFSDSWRAPDHLRSRKMSFSPCPARWGRFELCGHRRDDVSVQKVRTEHLSQIEMFELFPTKGGTHRGGFGMQSGRFFGISYAAAYLHVSHTHNRHALCI